MKGKVLTVTIVMRGSAFDDGNDGATEASRLLNDAAALVFNFGSGSISRKLIDINGNTAGNVVLAEQELPEP